MQTRSQTKSALYIVNIDFNAASEAWKANKQSIGNGCYKYICCKKGKNNNSCISKCMPGEDYCRTHLRLFKNGNKY